MTVVESDTTFGKNRARRRLLMSLAVVACFAAAAIVLRGTIKTLWRLPLVISNESTMVEGVKRTYRLVMPDSARGKHDVPLVFALHGALDTTDEMAAYSNLDRLAAEKGFLLVYLQGRQLNWPPSIPAENPTYIDNDLRFFEAMCDEMASKYGADAKRVYVVGVSQGGAMANLLTAKCSERIAATVCCCGWMPHPLDVEPLNTKHKCPVRFLVGSQDQQVPPKMVRKGYEVFERAGHPVEFRVLPGLGHGWPAVNEEIWEFLVGKRLR